MSDLQFQFVAMLAFVFASAPAVIHNLFSGDVTNAHNAILFIAGCVVNAVGLYLGHYEFSAGGLLVGCGIAIGLVILFAKSLIGGGVIKFLMALIPWLGIAEYFAVVAVGMFLIAMAARMDADRSPVAPALSLCAAVALMLPIIGA